MSGAKKVSTLKEAQDLVAGANAAATEAAAVVNDAQAEVDTAEEIAKADGATKAHKDAATAAGKELAEVTKALETAEKAFDAAKKVALNFKPPYVMGAGKAVTATKKRVLSDGDAVTADDLEGGKKAFDALVKAELIVKNK